MLCPYCSERETDSRDEVFTRFLGGKAWVAACRQCNSTFGYTIEASALRHLKDLMFLLRRRGMPPSKPMTWRKDGLDPDGETYDIDQDFKAIRSKPTIERDATGRITRASGNRRHIEQVAKSMAREGRAGRIVAAEPITVDVQKLRVTYPMDDDTKRLCIKMSVAAAGKTGLHDTLDSVVRDYLISGSIVDTCRVRIAVDEHPDFDRQRPRVGHLVYVHANPVENRIYSVVQLFAFMQFYCELAHEYKGMECAVLATHDPLTHEETFDCVSPVSYAVPARWLSGTLFERLGKRLSLLQADLVALYGDQAPKWFADAGEGSPTPR